MKKRKLKKYIKKYLREYLQEPDVINAAVVSVDNLRGIAAAFGEDAAKEADPALKEFMGQYDGSGASQNSGGETESGETSDEGESTEIVALDSCNVRSTPTTEEDNIIGSLYVGETAVKLGETDDGWTQIDYNGETAYVSSDFVATPEEAEAQNEADYFAPGAVE